MSIEHEAKILDIDPVAITKLILDHGGSRVDEQSMRRRVYDIVPGDQSKWVRLRDSGTGVTLAVKHITSDAIDGTHEYEVTVSDFDKTNELLGVMGFAAKSYQENKRESFNLEGAEVSVDSWPRIPPYLEIEAESKDEVVRVAKILGYGPKDLTGENTVKVYARYGIDLTTISDLRF